MIDFYLALGIWAAGALLSSFVLALGENYCTDDVMHVGRGLFSLIWPIWIPFWLIGKVGYVVSRLFR